MILINSSPKDALKIFQSFLPIFVPVGIGYLLAMCEREGIEPLYVDEQIEDDVIGRVSGLVSGMKKPYVFGFSVLTAAMKTAIPVSKRLKEMYPDSVILFGGIHPTAMPDEVLSYPHVDFVIRGEGDYSLVELYKCLKEGRDYSHIKGLSFRSEGGIIHNDRAAALSDLVSLPPFPYHLFDTKHYDLGFVISSRGCPYRCIFCSNRVTTGRMYRSRPSAEIADELQMLHDKYNRRYVFFIDDNLLVNKQRIYSLIEEIKKKGLHTKMTFNFQARGDNVSEQLLSDMYGAGFRSVFFGMETASEALMKIVKKGETVAQCIEAVKTAKKIGFHVSATFIYSLPTETHADRMDCIRLSRELKLDMVRFNNATPYPGTELYEIAKSEGRLYVQGLYENFNSVSTFSENPFKKIPFSYVPASSTEDEIRRDTLFSYFSYYLDIEKLKTIFARPDLNVGWFNAGDKLTEFIKKIPALVALGLLMFVKFCQLFNYTVIKRKTAISFGFFLKVFDGLRQKRKRE